MRDVEEHVVGIPGGRTYVLIVVHLSVETPREPWLACRGRTGSHRH